MILTNYSIFPPCNVLNSWNIIKTLIFYQSCTVEKKQFLNFVFLVLSIGAIITLKPILRTTSKVLRVLLKYFEFLLKYKYETRKVVRLLLLLLLLLL